MQTSSPYRWFTTPYGAWESVCTLWRICSGPSRHNPSGVSCLPNVVLLNEVKPQVRVAFIGDIMEMSAGVFSSRLRELVIGDDVLAFLADCDALVANFEGTIGKDRKKRFPDQAHDPSILQALSTLCDPAELFISVANNHAADFGRAAFEESVKALQNAGFRVFGTAQFPDVCVADGIYLIAGSMWSNKRCDYIATLDSPASQCRAGAMNILFPHWGFEIESYPRRQIVDLARRLLSSFAAIAGHHSHTPQPISAYTADDGLVRPVAYSLGNFCCGTKISRYRTGQILKLELGRTVEGHWAVGRLAWTFVESTHRGRTVHVSLSGSETPFH